MGEDPSTDYIMVATGTGIAPFRGFVRRLFFEDTPAADAYKGQAWLFLGVANSDALLYDDEFQDAKARYPDNFRLDYALSREQENKGGEDVHPGQGRGVRRRDLQQARERRAHVLLRPQGDDAGHPGHARGRVRIQGHRLRRVDQGPQEVEAVARRGVLEESSQMLWVPHRS